MPLYSIVGYIAVFSGPHKSPLNTVGYSKVVKFEHFVIQKNSYL